MLGPTSYTFARKEVRLGKKNDSPPDCWDPTTTSSQARKCLTVGSHLVEAYVALSSWSRTCTYILVDVEARTCRSRGTHVACTRTYSGQGARKKIRSRMCTYGRGLERLVAHTAKRRKRTSYGRNGGPVNREGCGVPQYGGNRPPMVGTGVLLIRTYN